MIKFVNAKLNIGLNIIRKREDGYHELQTLFIPVGLFNGTPENPEPFCDILEINMNEEAGGDRYLFTGNTIDCPTEKNLVYKAVELFKKELLLAGERFPSFSVTLEKHIPDGAGLGGGSADASFTLACLNELCGMPFSKDKLKKMAVLLGADCAFFIENRPMLASGIGEIMTPLSPKLDNCWAVIIKPDVYIPTKEAFSSITPTPPTKAIEDIVALPVEQWEDAGLKNDFETPLFAKHPLLPNIKQRLKENGALYAAMSGSGSSIFGIFSSEGAAREAFNALCKEWPEQYRHFLCKL